LTPEDDNDDNTVNDDNEDNGDNGDHAGNADRHPVRANSSDPSSVPSPPPVVPDSIATPLSVQPDPLPRVSSELSPVPSEDSADGVNPLDGLESPDMSSSSPSLVQPSKHAPPLSRSAFQARELMGRTPPTRVGGGLSPIAGSSGRLSRAGADNELETSISAASQQLDAASAMDATLALWLQTAANPTQGAASEQGGSVLSTSRTSSNLELTTKTQQTSESLRQFLNTEHQVLEALNGTDV
jgi:hypothetical protein